MLDTLERESSFAGACEILLKKRRLDSLKQEVCALERYISTACPCAPEFLKSKQIKGPYFIRTFDECTICGKRYNNEIKYEDMNRDIQ